MQKYALSSLETSDAIVCRLNNKRAYLKKSYFNECHNKVRIGMTSFLQVAIGILEIVTRVH